MTTPPLMRADARRIVRRLERDIAALGALQGLTFEELAVLLRKLDQPRKGLTQQLASVRDTVRTEARQEFPEGHTDVLVPGAGILKRATAGGSYAYEGGRIARTIASRVADEAFDQTTGEMLPLGVICERVAQRIIDAAGLDRQSQTWRRGVLEALGLDPADYSDKRAGRSSVRFID